MTYNSPFSTLTSIVDWGCDWSFRTGKSGENIKFSKRRKPALQSSRTAKLEGVWWRSSSESVLGSTETDDGWVWKVERIGTRVYCQINLRSLRAFPRNNGFSRPWPSARFALFPRHQMYNPGRSVQACLRPAGGFLRYSTISWGYHASSYSTKGKADVESFFLKVTPFF